MISKEDEETIEEHKKIREKVLEIIDKIPEKFLVFVLVSEPGKDIFAHAGRGCPACQAKIVSILSNAGHFEHIGDVDKGKEKVH